jgi:hypothetical protein
MRTTVLPTARGRAALGVLLLLLAVGAPLRAQSFDWKPDGLPDRNFDLGPTGSPPPALNPQRIRLFRFCPGFLCDPIGLQDDDPAPGTPDNPGPEPDNGPNWLQMAVGNDLPFFDFRRPGDPGGLGYNRLVTQVAVLDSRTTACSIGLQAVTPAGLQFNGVQDGPTVVSPALGIFHAFNEDTALQGFIGKNVTLSNAAAAPTPVHRNIQYGMAVQRSLLDTGPDAFGSLYFFVGALGRYRVDHDSPSQPPNLELLPGLHWRLSDTWWMSGGVMLPVISPRTDNALPWQLTCSFQF